MKTSPQSPILLPRRQFLKVSAFSGIGLLLGGCGTSQFEEEIGKAIMPVNDKVESILFNPARRSEFSKSAIEPDALVVNTAEDRLPEIDPKTYLLQVDGLVDRPLSLSLADLKRLTYTSMIIRHICVEGWAAITQWGGVCVKDVLALAAVKSHARYAWFESAGKTYYESWDLPSVLHSQTLLAYEKNFLPLPPDNGAPLRLASPIKLGYKQSKWVTRITLVSELASKKGYWEDQGYEWFAGL